MGPVAAYPVVMTAPALARPKLHVHAMLGALLAPQTGVRTGANARRGAAGTRPKFYRIVNHSMDPIHFSFYVVFTVFGE